VCSALKEEAEHTDFNLLFLIENMGVRNARGTGHDVLESGRWAAHHKQASQYIDMMDELT